MPKVIYIEHGGEEHQVELEVQLQQLVEHLVLLMVHYLQMVVGQELDQAMKMMVVPLDS